MRCASTTTTPRRSPFTSWQAVAEDEARRISLRTREALAQEKRNGVRLGPTGEHRARENKAAADQFARGLLPIIEGIGAAGFTYKLAQDNPRTESSRHTDAAAGMSLARHHHSGAAATPSLSRGLMQHQGSAHDWPLAVSAVHFPAASSTSTWRNTTGPACCGCRLW